MSVIVKGMEMPKNCTRCDYIGLNAAIGCSVMSGTNGRATDCPLGALPSAQPEIIRCKDCKWKQGAECVRFADVRPFADDFCSRAERRTDEAD